MLTQDKVVEVVLFPLMVAWMVAQGRSNEILTVAGRVFACAS
jgi:hypothetical protein